MSSNIQINLANLLGLRPLDRVQINDQVTMRDATLGLSPGQPKLELPFWFFQRVVGDKLEVRRAGGYTDLIEPTQICDVIPGEPITVMAMPEKFFHKRISLSQKERNEPAPSDWFFPAQVLYAEKDRWGRPAFLVWFEDQALNTTGRPWRANMPWGDMDRLKLLANRKVMPVIGSGTSNWSSDHGCEARAAYQRRATDTFLQGALRHNREVVGSLSSIDIKPPTVATINRMRAAIGVL